MPGTGMTRKSYEHRTSLPALAASNMGPVSLTVSFLRGVVGLFRRGLHGVIESYDLSYTRADCAIKLVSWVHPGLPSVDKHFVSAAATPRTDRCR